MPPHAPDEPLELTTSIYRLTCAADRPFVSLETARGDPLAHLFVLSGVHTVAGRDDTTAIGEWRLVDQGDHVALELTAGSSLWRSKTYRFRCWEERLSYEIEVEGEGSLTGVDYFGGYSSARLRWGSGFFWSGGAFLRGFNPEPTGDERYHFLPTESSVIDTTGVPLAGRAGWFFTPPPFCFAFEHAGGWLAVGVEARPGENRFNEFHYRAHRDGFHFGLPFESQPRVRGLFRLPALGFDFARGEYEALGGHVASLRAQRLVPVPTKRPRPSWWAAPIFCGWGAQCHLAKGSGRTAPQEATQENYERFLAILESQGLSPGTVVIDDKWQSSYGANLVDEEKWPDLPGFIGRQHARGRRVLLWLKAWDPEGLPEGECVTNASGAPVGADPTAPAYEGRLRDSVRTMLSPDGYGADGFKLDFTARIPASPGLRMHDRRVWGLELMRRYLEILHGEAKRVKDDALVITHTPHPYLADVTDMVRLNDINVAFDPTATMVHRAKIARLACPEALLDTDNWPLPGKAAWRAYTRLQPELGVPSLYFVSHVDGTGEALDEEDYRLVRDTWALSRAREEALAGVGE